jgi:hypothetical protein
MSELLNPVDKSPKTWAWFIIHILFPLLPVIIGGLIRFGLNLQLTMDTFSSSELAICVAFLCILVYQSLLKNERLLDNEDKKKEAEGMATLYLICAILLIVGYSVITVLNCLPENIQLVQNGKIFMNLSIFSSSVVLTIGVINVQRSYKLKGAIP